MTKVLRNLILLISFSSLFLSNNGFAQSCVEFEDINNNTSYGPPNYEAADLLFSTDDVSATLTPFTDINGQSTLLNVQVQTLNQGDLSGQTLFLNNAGVQFDYSAVVGTLGTVGIDFAYYGGAINIRINGQELLILEQLIQGSYQPTPQNQMFVFFEDDINGRLLFNGFIETLEIGGQEIYIDNVCHTLMTDCEFTNVFAEAHPCEDNSFLLDVEFDYVNVGNSNTYMSMGNQTFGPLALGEPFYTIGPFLGGQDYTLTIFTSGGSANGCSVIYYDVPTPECGISGNCEIGTPSLNNFECDGNFFYATLDFEYANTSDSFNLYISNLADTYTDIIAYTDLPLTVGPINADVVNTFGLSVYDSVNENACGNGIEFAGPECNNSCTLADLIIEAYDCDDEGNFLIDLDLNYTGVSDSFDLYINGDGPEDYYETYAYSDLYITFGPFEGTGELVEIFIVDQQNPNCWTIATIETPNCGTECAVSGLETSFPVCNPNGSYNIDINFDYINPGNGFFDLFNANGEIIGFYALEDLPITLDDYVPSDDNLEIFQVCINDNPNCCSNLLTVQFPNCNDNCEISDLVVEPYDCDDEGNFLIDLGFNYANTSDSFDLFINGDGPEDFYGTYAYADVFITFGPFEGNGEFLEIFVVDQQNPNCWQTSTIQTPNCSNECEISVIGASFPECNPTGGYDISINLDYANPENEFFDLFNANGELIGFYSLADLPITLTNYVPSENTFEVFQACINDNPDCCSNLLTVDFPDCSNNCEIWDLIVEPYDCDDDGNYLIDLDFNFANLSDSFAVFSFEPNFTFYYGNFAYADLHLTLGPIESDAEILEFQILDLENQNCSASFTLETPDCNNSNCEIWDLEVFDFVCYDNWTYDFNLNFNYANVDNAFFDVINSNGEIIGTYALEDLPISIESFPDFGNNFEAITICINDNPNCCATIEFETPDCTGVGNSCIEFEGLTDGINYGGPYSNPGDLLMIENGVLVTLEGVPDPLGNLNYDYLFATTQDICSPFNAADNNRLFMFNGVKFDFSQLPQYPTEVSFPYFDCGIPFAISANGQTPVTYLAPTVDTTFDLTSTVSISISLNANDSQEGYITLTGDPIETFYIGGVELQIDNVCFNVTTEDPEVWPGDCNYDNTANNFDVLNLGIAYGAEGPERSMSNTDWAAMPAEDWIGFFADGETNFKHADSDGNGEINSNDLSAIEENYNLDHGEVPIFVQMPGTPNDPPFFVEVPDADQIEIGVPFNAPILLGSSSIPVDEIYGIAFTLEFDIDMFDESSVAILLNDSWMGTNGDNMITLNQSFANEGRFEIALTRTNQENTTGYGPIGHFIGIIDDILGRTEIEITIDRVKAINFSERPVPLHLQVKIVDLATNTNELSTGQIDIFPNPTSEEIQVINSSEQVLNQLKVYNVLGQLMTSIHSPENIELIDVKSWPSGVYFVIIEGEYGTITKKIEKINK